MSVIDTSSNTVVATVPVGSDPYGVAVNPLGTPVYVSNYGSNTVSVIDTSSNTVVATIGVGSQPYGVAVNPSGTRVYVANSIDGTVSVIDTSSNSVVATVTGFAGPIAYGQFIVGAAQTTYTISGTISSGGTGISDVTVTLSGAGSGTTTTDSNGNYTFTGLSNGSYTVTPSKSGYTFTPDNVTINGASQTGDNIMASSGGGSGGGGGLSARAGGYSPAWLIITLISLTLAGGYLMRNRMVLS